MIQNLLDHHYDIPLKARVPFFRIATLQGMIITCCIVLSSYYYFMNTKYATTTSIRGDAFFTTSGSGVNDIVAFRARISSSIGDLTKLPYCRRGIWERTQTNCTTLDPDDILNSDSLNRYDSVTVVTRVVDKGRDRGGDVSMYVVGSEFVDIWISHSAWNQNKPLAQSTALEMTGQLVDLDGTVITELIATSENASDTSEVTMKKNRHTILSLQMILQAAGIDSLDEQSDITTLGYPNWATYRHFGVILKLEFTYNNHVANTLKTKFPYDFTMRVRRVTGHEYYGVGALTNTSYRTLLYGVRLEISQSGSLVVISGTSIWNGIIARVVSALFVIQFCIFFMLSVSRQMGLGGTRLTLGDTHVDDPSASCMCEKSRSRASSEEDRQRRALLEQPLLQQGEKNNKDDEDIADPIIVVDWKEVALHLARHYAGGALGVVIQHHASASNIDSNQGKQAASEAMKATTTTQRLRLTPLRWAGECNTHLL